MVRDLFSSILFLSLQHKIDTEEVFSYSLTSVALLLCHVNGLKQTTPKVKLSYELESRFQTIYHPNVDATVIDAIFFLHLQKKIPGTFGALPSYYLTLICAEKGNELHMVFDKVQSPSIKNCERDEKTKNEGRESNYQITGPCQQTPNNWLETCRNDNFKVSLNKFLVDIWKNDCFGGISKEKKLYVTDGNVCYLFEVSSEKMVRMIQPIYIQYTKKLTQKRFSM